MQTQTNVWYIFVLFVNLNWHLGQFTVVNCYHNWIAYTVIFYIVSKYRVVFVIFFELEISSVHIPSVNPVSQEVLIYGTSSGKPSGNSLVLVVCHVYMALSRKGRQLYERVCENHKIVAN